MSIIEIKKLTRNEKEIIEIRTRQRMGITMESFNIPLYDNMTAKEISEIIIDVLENKNLYDVNQKSEF